MGAQTEIREADTVGNEATMNRLTPGCAIVPVELQDPAVGAPLAKTFYCASGMRSSQAPPGIYDSQKTYERPTESGYAIHI